MKRDQFLQSKILNNDGTEYICYGEFDFSTWEGFGKLWEWVIRQKFIQDFIDYSEFNDGKLGHKIWLQELINPDRFADTVAKYLGWEK